MRAVFLLGALSSLAAASQDDCSECHAIISQRQGRSHHAAALRPIAASPLLPVLRGNSHPAGADPALAYEVQPDGVRVISDSGVAATLQWAFGAGAQGITPVGTLDGRTLEHRFSYYPKARRFGLTFGHPDRPQGPEALLGLPQDAQTLVRCFGCHSTGEQPGITCERCHGPAQAHIQAARAGASKEALRRTLVNPGRFPAKAQVQFCGQCHRLPEPGSNVPEPEIEDPVTVRFAPIGLLASRCFQASKRLACTTCHDTHDNTRPRGDEFYAQRCRDCHAESRTRCPRPAKGDCLSCHMKQASLGPYLMFTDHRIRIP